MKINDINRINSINKVYNNYSELQKFNKKTAGKDEVHISEEAKQLLESSRAEQTDRSEQIQKLKQEVQAGTYFIDAGKIAEKLLPFFKE